jgi:hypothetical protein
MHMQRLGLDFPFLKEKRSYRTPLMLAMHGQIHGCILIMFLASLTSSCHRERNLYLSLYTFVNQRARSKSLDLDLHVIPLSTKWKKERKRSFRRRYIGE